MTELRETRMAATRSKIALRHAEDDAADYLTFVTSGIDYASLGKNADSRKQAFNAMLALDEKAQELEKTLRACQDTKDLTDCELECILDEIKADRAKTWATLADWTRGRTASGRMGSQERAGKEILQEQVEDALADDLAF